MAKLVRFAPKKTPHGWRLNIPPKFSKSGKRQQLHFPTREKALEAAANLKEARETFGDQASAISPTLADAATAAARLLEPLGIGLLEAVRRFVDQETRNLASVTVKAAVDAFRATGEGWSDSQARAYRVRGDKLTEAFGDRMISTVTAAEIQEHLKATTGTASTFNMNVRLVRAFWRWCAKPPRKWCDAEAVAHLETQGTVSSEVGVLNHKQAAAIMGAAEAHFPDCVPAFAIALFSGMRQAEIERLTIRDFKPDGITVPAISAKTKRRRFIQMTEPLQAWLKAYPVRESVVPTDWTRKEKAVRRLAGWSVWSGLVPSLKVAPPLPAEPPDDLPEWPSNALRHTAATMALALGRPIEQLVFEHGHAGGLAMLRKHYVGTLPKAEALKIWSLRPNGQAEALKIWNLRREAEKAENIQHCMTHGRN
jgi:integrase